MSADRQRPACPAVKLSPPNYWHFDEESWSWQRRSSAEGEALASAATQSARDALAFSFAVSGHHDPVGAARNVEALVRSILAESGLS
jgi:hypothetical protein